MKFSSMMGAAALAFALAASATAQDRVTVALGDVSLNKVAFLVAADNGIYEKYDLDVHQFITQSAANRISRSGVNVPPDFVGTSADSETANISIGGGSPLIYSMTTLATAVDRVIIATTDSTATFHIIAREEVADEDDLLGRRLGFSSVGSVSHLMALEYLRQKGWSPTEDVSLMREGMDYSALEAGDVDAFIGSSIYFTMAGQYGARSLVNLTEYNIPLAGSGVNVEREWYAENRDVAKRFVQAMIEAYALMRSDYEVFTDVLEKWYGITDAEQAQGMFDETEGWLQVPYPAVEGIALVQELFDHRELRRRDISEFYDDSIVRELEESGFIAETYANYGQ